MWISVWLSWRTLMPYLSIRSCWRRIQTLWKPLKWWVFWESHFNGKFPYKTILMGRVPVKPSSVPVNHWKSTWYWQMLNCEHITDSKNKDVMYSCDIQFHLGTFLIQILMVYWCVTIIKNTSLVTRCTCNSMPVLSIYFTSLLFHKEYFMGSFELTSWISLTFLKLYKIHPLFDSWGNTKGVRRSDWRQRSFITSSKVSSYRETGNSTARYVILCSSV